MAKTPELTVLYDGNCKLCRASVARLQRFDTDHRIEMLDLHDASAAARFPQVDREVALRLMQAVSADGRLSSGVEAFAEIGRLLPGWKWISWLLLVPGIHWAASKIYGWVARNRYRWNSSACADGSCNLHVPSGSSHKT
jgi:predicted DCC family thiol-disulfide oxidoreductase YuxK